MFKTILNWFKEDEPNFIRQAYLRCRLCDIRLYRLKNKYMGKLRDGDCLQDYHIQRMKKEYKIPKEEDGVTCPTCGFGNIEQEIDYMEVKNDVKSDN